MKKLVFTMLLIVSSYAFSSQADTDYMAEIKVSGNSSLEKSLVELFAKEAIIPHSKLNNYMSALKADPENQDLTIDDYITQSDIVRLDSGASAGHFGISYLIIIRAGYKSNISQVGYLKAYAMGPIDENEPTTIRITEPARVVIE